MWGLKALECEICLDTIPNHSEKCPTCLIELPIEKPVGDKRNSPRFPIKRPIRVIYEDGSMEQSLGNISTSGCMVHSFFPKSIHDEVEVEIKIAENNSTKLKGKVIRTLKNHPFMGNLSYEHLRIPINCTKCDFKIVEKSPNFDKCPNCKAELVKQVPHVYGIGIMFDDMDPKERLLLSRLISGLHNESKRLNAIMRIT